jgi:uncharacterized MAPEG superfamily protein
MNTLYQNAHSPERAPVHALKFLDVPFVVIGAIVALALGAPSLGVIVGAAGWILQRAIQLTDRRFTARVHDPQKQVGIHVSESFGRIWLLAAAIVIAGVVGDRKDGLAAAILIFAAYSVAFVMRIIDGPPPERELE